MYITFRNKLVHFTAGSC